MWRNVSTVAKNFRLDEEKLLDFAAENEDEFKIVYEPPGSGILMVSTWHTDELVASFKRTMSNTDE